MQARKPVHRPQYLEVRRATREADICQSQFLLVSLYGSVSAPFAEEVNDAKELERKDKEQLQEAKEQKECDNEKQMGQHFVTDCGALTLEQRPECISAHLWRQIVTNDVLMITYEVSTPDRAAHLKSKYIFVEPKKPNAQERESKEKLDREPKADRLVKAETDRLAKAEADRLAKAEADRLAKAEADRLAKEQKEKQEADGKTSNEDTSSSGRRTSRLTKVTRRPEDGHGVEVDEMKLDANISSSTYHWWDVTHTATNAVSNHVFRLPDKLWFKQGRGLKFKPNKVTLKIFYTPSLSSSLDWEARMWSNIEERPAPAVFPVPNGKKLQQLRVNGHSLRPRH